MTTSNTVATENAKTSTESTLSNVLDAVVELGESAYSAVVEDCGDEIIEFTTSSLRTVSKTAGMTLRTGTVIACSYNGAVDAAKEFLPKNQEETNKMYSDAFDSLKGMFETKEQGNKDND